MSVLSKGEIERLINEKKMVVDYKDLASQLQPCGIDLTAKAIFSFTEGGSVDFDNSKRIIASNLQPVPFGHLKPGVYKIVLNEIVSIPLDVMALARTRSTLLRNGASVQTAVWDPGYSGRSECMLVVSNPHGITIHEGAKVLQLIFFTLDKETKGYSGRFHMENI